MSDQSAGALGIEVVMDIVDYAEPRMDVYEFALYMFLVRHTRFIGVDEGVFGFKSLRKTLVVGVGEKGKPMSEGTCYEKLRSLEQKGFLKSHGTERAGQRLGVWLPNEIPGLVVKKQEGVPEADIDSLDFFASDTLRASILDRDHWRCFYCFKNLTKDNYVLEHVISRPTGDNSYRNLVAACLSCNNKKNSTPVDDFLRDLYRAHIISDDEFKEVMENLRQLQAGLLKPSLTSPSSFKP
jgi:hypothetical protein